MNIWTLRLLVVAAPLLLTGCLWGPGKFVSDLALNRNGSFVLDYRGEILLQIPDEARETPRPEPWSSDKAVCYESGATKVGPVDAAFEDENDPKRPCSASETAKLKAEFEKAEAERVAKKRSENDATAKVFGLPGTDDESNRAFAAKLMKYAGWRSVTYRGKGLFDVNYHFEGRLTQDYAFPMLPDADLMVPFIALRRRADGTVLMTGPGLAGGNPMAAKAKAAGLPGNDPSPPSRAEGRFTVTTDGEILTNNSEDGPTGGPGARQLLWDIGPASSKVPEALVRL